MALCPFGQLQVVVASIALRSVPDYCSSLAADGVQQGQWAWLARAQGWLSTLVMAGTSSRWASASEQGGA